MARKSATVKLCPEKALSAPRGGSVGIIAVATGLLCMGVGAVQASDCYFGWDPDIGNPGVQSPQKHVLAFTWYNDGNGLKLYAGGSFHVIGGAQADLVARWDGGSNWSSIAGEFYFSIDFADVAALTTWFNPVRQNEELYFAGRFLDMGAQNIVFNHIGAYDGVNVFPLSDNGTIGVAGNDMHVFALAVFQNDLFAAGSFMTAGNTVVNNIARWDGTTWHSLIDPDNPNDPGIAPGGRVFAMARFNDGNGDALYVGGAFNAAGGGTVSNIAKWDGSQWSQAGNGLNSTVYALHAHKIGIQTQLYAGGGFTLGGNTGGVARLDSGVWALVGGGFDTDVRALATFEEGKVCGQAPQLFAGGRFGRFWDQQSQSWITANRLAKWDGTQWAPLLAEEELCHSNSNGVDDTVFALASGANDDAIDPNSLYVGGAFRHVFVSRRRVPAGCVGEWSCTKCIWDLDMDGQINPVDSGMVQAQFGCMVGTGIEACDKADIDGDCQVNPVDAALVQARFGTFCQSPSTCP